jgi:hypothetical protein
MSRKQPDDIEPDDLLAALNAEGVVEHPGRPEAERPSPADPDGARNDDAPAPG